METICDNEHVRRIERPVYKRRWDEQWKVNNRWVGGQPAYDAEFLDAVDWWLSEKAEWWLEHEKDGGPVTAADWTAALWTDARIQAAWEKEQSAPEDPPFAVPWEQIEKKRKVPAYVKSLRGKLNVPRERFWTTAAGEYKTPKFPA